MNALVKQSFKLTFLDYLLFCSSPSQGIWTVHICDNLSWPADFDRWNPFVLDDQHPRSCLFSYEISIDEHKEQHKYNRGNQKGKRRIQLNPAYRIVGERMKKRDLFGPDAALLSEGRGRLSMFTPPEAAFPLWDFLESTSACFNTCPLLSLPPCKLVVPFMPLFSCSCIWCFERIVSLSLVVESVSTAKLDRAWAHRMMMNRHTRNFISYRIPLSVGKGLLVRGNLCGWLWGYLWTCLFVD